MPAEASFESSVGFLLSQLGVLATRSWVGVLAERDLTPHHHRILLTLHTAGPLGATALADIVLIDPRNMGPVVAPLERRGLIQRGDDPADRRRRVISLTPAGTEAAAELAAATSRIEDELLAPLTPDERDALRSHLRLLWQKAKAP
ncbi:MAG: MarR family transcriptional regulator [Micropruina sp.]|uniref:MarR family winged helix-turn-helix transcriptional regulator n=1 Tax=Micropruina sp. TaxID=2737536 RepID=UPI0039E4BB6B